MVPDVLRCGGRLPNSATGERLLRGTFLTLDFRPSLTQHPLAHAARTLLQRGASHRSGH